MADKLTIEERLNDKIYQLESKIEKLEEEKEDAIYHDRWRWRMITKLTEEENWNLPLPRLEIRWEYQDDYNSVASYALVMRHLTGTIERIPIGSTSRSGRVEKADLSTPFRDGAHIRHGMRQTGLRGFVVNANQCRELQPNEQD